MAATRGARSGGSAAAAALVSVLLVSCLVAGGQGAEIRRQKNVQAALRAKWAGTPLLLEASELLSKEWKDLFWDFIDHWKELEKGSECLTAKCCAQKIVEDARTLLNEPLSSIFEFSLTLRSASPRLVLYRQLAKESLSSFPIDDSPEQISGHSTGKTFDGAVDPSSSGGTCCWVDTGNVLLFNSADLHEWLGGMGKLAMDSTEQPELFDFDHIYPHTNITAPIAILYGAVGTKCFKELHVQLAEASKQEKVRYALRPVLPSGCGTTSTFCGSVGAVDAVTLSGYGVELALKNMEYKAMDDTAIKKGVPLEDPKTEDLTQEVRGFIFSKILERKPELNAEIMAFRDYLLSSTVSDTLEVWELKDLGHQTAQRIVQASDPLQSMQEINQNFPSIVSSLSRMKLDDSIKDEIIANQRMVPPGKSLMALNGALINIEDLDLYLLMDMVHGELSLADQFVRLKLPQSAAHKILSAPPPAESNSFRVDFRSSHVHYLNNLEEDAMYRRWRNNIQEVWDLVEGIVLQQDVPDQFKWKLTPSGSYTSKSAYSAFFVGTIKFGPWRRIWKSWAPLRCKFFIWLVVHNRCWTADRLAKRGLPHQEVCPLCDQAEETINHLLVGCVFARQVWFSIFQLLGIVRLTPDLSVGRFSGWWSKVIRSVPKEARKGLNSLIILVAWEIWKHRNDCVFENSRPSPQVVLRAVSREGGLWCSAGAAKLQELMPSLLSLGV